MFSGIVETQASVLSFEPIGSSARIRITRPESFNDIQIGDSIAVNGVCLTVTSFNSEIMNFDLGPETLKITGWNAENFCNAAVNLERSLQANSRVHGHFVSGHVDEMGQVTNVIPMGEALELWIEFSKDFRPYVWKKGSVGVNGVSLTVNEVLAHQFQVTLIPETLKRTNLSRLKVADSVSLEADPMARGMVHFMQSQKQQETNL